MALQNGIMVETTRAFIILFLLSSPFFKGIQLKLAHGVEISPTQKKMETILQEKQGFRGKGYNNNYHSFSGWRMKKNERRLMIGSTAPICTYNECRGCRFKCRAEQIPVDANDPINSAYHYRCVCHT
uniref:STOMAGEN protein n=1 Tax=Potamogeton wrightii TaxID=384654 RepID=A0A1C9ZZ65_9LILI|nr:STOMAGEN protein [Potamogeton wrightii]